MKTNQNSLKRFSIGRLYHIPKLKSKTNHVYYHLNLYFQDYGMVRTWLRTVLRAFLVLIKESFNQWTKLYSRRIQWIQILLMRSHMKTSTFVPKDLEIPISIQHWQMNKACVQLIWQCALKIRQVWTLSVYLKLIGKKNVL